MSAGTSRPTVRRLAEQIASRSGGGTGLAILVALFALGLALRLGFAIDAPAGQPPDARAYAQIAANLYDDGSFDARVPGSSWEAQPSSAYSPGLPLFLAAVYELSGGVHLTLARLLLAVVGALAIPLTFLLGRRLHGRAAGMIGAAVIAIYPALLEYQGLLLTEPLAASLLAASLLAVLWAAGQGPTHPGAGPVAGQGPSSSQAAGEGPRPRATRASRWLVPGLLLGATALVRPEYLLVGAAFVVLVAVWGVKRSGWKPGLSAAGLLGVGLLLAVVPWTVRNAVVLDRVVPISTGGGKALYVGTHLDAGGDGPALRELLLERRPGLRARLQRGGAVDDPDRLVLERLLGRLAAERHPGLEVDAALGRLGRRSLERNLTDHPGSFGALLAEKAFHTWTDAPRASMRALPWRVLQFALLAFALLGFVLIARNRRFEALAIGLVLLYVTAIGALLIASPRRELVVLPLLAALAGAGASASCSRLRGRTDFDRPPAR